MEEKDLYRNSYRLSRLFWLSSDMDWNRCNYFHHQNILVVQEFETACDFILPFCMEAQTFETCSDFDCYPDESRVGFSELSGIRFFIINFQKYCRFRSNQHFERRVHECRTVLGVWLWIHDRGPKERVVVGFRRGRSVFQIWVLMQNRTFFGCFPDFFLQ